MARTFLTKRAALYEAVSFALSLGKSKFIAPSPWIAEVTKRPAWIVFDTDEPHFASALEIPPRAETPLPQYDDDPSAPYGMRRNLLHRDLVEAVMQTAEYVGSLADDPDISRLRAAHAWPKTYSDLQ